MTPTEKPDNPKQAALDDIQIIRDVAGDLDHGFIGTRIRGNIGGVVSRACDRLEQALRRALLEPEPNDLYNLLRLHRMQTWAQTSEYNWEFVEDIIRNAGKTLEQFYNESPIKKPEPLDVEALKRYPEYHEKEEKSIWDPKADRYNIGWNAALDKVKELLAATGRLRGGKGEA